MRHVSALLMLSLTSAAVALTGCADPNPTFVFDAAPAVREGGTGGAGGNGAVDAGAAQDGADDGTDGPGAAR